MPQSSILLAVDALAGAAVLACIALHVRRLKKRPKAVADLMDHEPLAGQDKWLGGVLGSDGCVYGVPGHAKHVLKLDGYDGDEEECWVLLEQTPAAAANAAAAEEADEA